MKKLTELINEELILSDLNYAMDNNLNEGFFGALKKFFGTSGKAMIAGLKGFSDEFANAYLATDVAAVKSKDQEIIKSTEEESKVMTDQQKHLEYLKKQVKSTMGNVDKMKDTATVFWYGQGQKLKELSTELKDEEGIKLSKKFMGKIDEKDNKAKENLNNLMKKTKDQAAQAAAGKVEDENENGGEAKNAEEAEEHPEQPVKAKIEKKAIEDTIKDNKDFIAPLAQAAQIDGNELRKYVQGIIDSSFKTYDENKRLVWNNEVIEEIATQEDGMDRLINGMSAMLCGMFILKNEKAIDAVNELEAFKPAGVAGKIKKLADNLKV